MKPKPNKVEAVKREFNKGTSVFRDWVSDTYQTYQDCNDKNDFKLWKVYRFIKDEAEVEEIKQLITSKMETIKLL